VKEQRSRTEGGMKMQLIAVAFIIMIVAAFVILTLSTGHMLACAVDIFVIITMAIQNSIA